MKEFRKITRDLLTHKRGYEDFQNNPFFCEREHLEKYLEELNEKYDRSFEVQDLINKKVLVIAENGYGDDILTWRCIKDIARRGNKVTFCVPKLLIPLLEEDLKTRNLNIALTQEISEEGFDNMLYIFDFYSMYKHKPRSRYLNIPRIPIETDKIKIGLAFGNSDTEPGMEYRNIPNKYTRYFKLPNVELYNFCNYKSSYINIREYCKDFLQTAQVLQEMDYFITADNVMLHLAGALGVKTYALFNKEYEYIWFNLNEENCGYYKTVKPFICEEQDDWLPKVKEVRDRLNFDIEKKI